MRAPYGRAAVFLDRDGVINRRPPEHQYVRSTGEFTWLDGSAQAVSRLRAAGFFVVVVSNQRGIARGLVDWRTLGAIEHIIQEELARHGARVDAFYYCPHDREQACDCRKPAPGLLLRAAAEHHLDLGASVMIGDGETDVDAGRAAGCATVRVGARTNSTAADVAVPTLADAVAPALTLARQRARRKTVT